MFPLSKSKPDFSPPINEEGLASKVSKRMSDGYDNNQVEQKDETYVSAKRVACFDLVAVVG